MAKCLRSLDGRTTPSHAATSIENLFRFEMKSTVECVECKQTNTTTEPYFVWNVPIAGHTSLLSALDAFCRPEHLSGDNAYSCANCCKHVQASKRLSAVRVAPYLVFSLKRFQADLHRTSKLTHLVAYPEDISLDPYFRNDPSSMSREDEDVPCCNYRLYCVVVHLGKEIDKGHLFAYVRASNDEWYKADDSIVNLITLDQVLSAADAYLLFYAEAAAATSAVASSFETKGSSISSNSPRPAGELSTTDPRAFHDGSTNSSRRAGKLSTEPSPCSSQSSFSIDSPSDAIGYVQQTVSQPRKLDQESRSDPLHRQLASTITIGNKTYGFESLNLGLHGNGKVCALCESFLLSI
jgi:hypothetical protein